MNPHSLVNFSDKAASLLVSFAETEIACKLTIKSTVVNP
jgi:hypothetical protein